MRLSVVVTIVDGGAALARCLSALASQVDGPELEVLVPYDAAVADEAGLPARWPTFRFVAMDAVATARPITTEAGRHEHYDRGRSAGLSAATGDLVAMLEDRGVPRPDWARSVAELHARLPHEVIGGPVGWRGRGVLSWAVYACDFGRFAPPQAAGPREYVTDINVSYKRAALERTRELWEQRYHETTVHWALRRAGVTLWLAPEACVDQIRDEVRLAPLLAERVAWGRLFAATRAAEVGEGRRLLLAAATLLLPLLLLGRIVARQLRRAPLRLIAAAPVLALLLICWSAGEGLGYLTGEG